KEGPASHSSHILVVRPRSLGKDSGNKIDDDSGFHILQYEIVADDSVGEFWRQPGKAEQQSRGHRGHWQVLGIVAIHGQMPLRNGFSLAYGPADVASAGTLQDAPNHAPKFLAGCGSEDVTRLGVGATLPNLLRERMPALDDFLALLGGPQPGHRFLQFYVSLRSLREFAERRRLRGRGRNRRR